tara:strand:- start:3498 stop:3650 length:153 start_codon:yes stop_codon:yes gene_type:complete
VTDDKRIKQLKGLDRPLTPEEMEELWDLENLKKYETPFAKVQNKNKKFMV